MTAKEKLELLLQSKASVSVNVDVELLKELLPSDVPPECRIVAFERLGETRMRGFWLQGEICWYEGSLCIEVEDEWPQRLWERSLGMVHHMELMQKLLEFRRNESGDIHTIIFHIDLDWGYSFYRIKPTDPVSLFELYRLGKDIQIWIRETTERAQDHISREFLKISSGYSAYKLLDLPRLIKKVETEVDAYKKGRVLEELVSKIFGLIDGFEVIERSKTETEEIDIVVVNKSQHPFWLKESSILLVECKNWASKSGKNELVAFREKIANRRGRSKVGFFVSWNGFTDTFAVEEMRRSQEDIIIIALQREDIIEAVESNDLQALIERWWANALST